MYVTPTPPRLRMIAAGKLTRHRRAWDGLSREGMADLRARIVNAAMAAAIENLMALAFVYGSLARKLDRRTGSPHAMTEEQWASVLTAYSRIDRRAS